MNPDKSQKSALTEIESRISILERRLRNAKAARNSYVDYLRGKYPTWKPELPTYQKRLKTDEHMVSKLATSSYHWEGQRPIFPRPPPPVPEFFHQIPKRGPFMESDFHRTRERLNLMSHQLRILRDARLNMTTDDYFRTRAVRARDEPYEGDFEKVLYQEITAEEIPSLDGVRKRLADMSFSLMEPPSTPTKERIEEMQRIEAREKLVQDIRAGVLPSVTAEPIDARPPSRPATASKSEETKVVTSQPSAAPSQTRIQFTDSKAVPAPPTPVTTAPVPTPQKAPAEEASNPFSRIMGLLSKSDSTDSDDVQLEAVPPPPKPAAAPQPLLGSLSQYLQKSSTSGASTTKPTTMFGAFSGAAGKKNGSDGGNASDDDFFD